MAAVSPYFERSMANANGHGFWFIRGFGIRLGSLLLYDITILNVQTIVAIVCVLAEKKFIENSGFSNILPRRK